MRWDLACHAETVVTMSLPPHEIGGLKGDSAWVRSGAPMEGNGIPGHVALGSTLAWECGEGSPGFLATFQQ